MGDRVTDIQDDPAGSRGRHLHKQVHFLADGPLWCGQMLVGCPCLCGYSCLGAHETQRFCADQSESCPIAWYLARMEEYDHGVYIYGYIIYNINSNNNNNNYLQYIIYIYIYLCVCVCQYLCLSTALSHVSRDLWGAEPPSDAFVHRRAARPRRSRGDVAQGHGGLQQVHGDLGENHGKTIGKWWFFMGFDEIYHWNRWFMLVGWFCMVWDGEIHHVWFMFYSIGMFLWDNNKIILGYWWIWKYMVPPI